jgi:hypothetical protein
MGQHLSRRRRRAATAEPPEVHGQQEQTKTAAADNSATKASTSSPLNNEGEEPTGTKVLSDCTNKMTVKAHPLLSYVYSGLY